MRAASIDRTIDPAIDQTIDPAIAPTLDPARVREILVRGPNWLGDLVMSTPGLRALRGHFPGARITLQLRPEHAPLLRGSPMLDRVLPLQRQRADARTLLAETLELRRDSRERGARYDLGVCIPDSFSSALRMRLAGVRHIVGYAGGGRGALLHQRVAAPARPTDGGRAMLARESHVLGLMEALGCPARGSELELHVRPEDDAALERVLSSRVIGAGDEAWVALAPGASFGPSKQWPAEYFAEVGDRLACEGARVLLLGSAGEAALTAAVQGAMKEDAVDLAGALDLAALKALIRRLALLVCNDAGARHIAVAFGVPCLVFFGPTSLAKTNLNLEGVQVLQRHDDCRPCYLRECPIDHRCLRGIEPGPVAERALKLLARAPTRDGLAGEVEVKGEVAHEVADMGRGAS